MDVKIMELLLIASLGWLLLEQSFVTCDYGGGKSQYPSMNSDTYGQQNKGGYQNGYENGDSYGGGEEERPKIKLNFGVHVPAMKIRLPRISLPKITIRAKVRQPNKPSTIHVPEINLETQSKVSPPDSKLASSGGDDGHYDSYGGSHNSDRNGYGAQKMQAYGGSNAGYASPSYQSIQKQPSPSYGGGNNHNKNQESIYLSASNSYRDGSTSLSLSNQGDNEGYASSNKKEYTTSGGDYTNRNYAQNSGNQMRYNTMNNNDHVTIDNYKSASTNNRDVVDARYTNQQPTFAIRDNSDSAAMRAENKYRVASNSILLNFPERFRSNQQTYMLDKSRSSSMIEPQANNDLVSKPVHLVYSAIQQLPTSSVNHEEEQQQQRSKNSNYHTGPNDKNNNNYVNANHMHHIGPHVGNSHHIGQETRTFFQKISSPFLNVRNWLRPNSRE